jgi:Competence protein CoiA-like family
MTHNGSKGVLPAPGALAPHALGLQLLETQTSVELLMPLRALLHQHEILAPSLPSGEWEALRERLQGDRGSLTLPCCRGRAFQRTSPRGLQHFYHAPESTCEDRGETLDHLTAKLAIVRGCEAAGYRATPEYTGHDWRADVLAARGPIRIAFEMQWSRLSMEETLQRQEKYNEVDIRGCWFFRVPPPGLRTSRSEQPLAARQDLPAFLIGGAPGDMPRVYLNGRHYPLEKFVTHLLRGNVRFRTHARIAPWQRVTLCFYEVRCWRCRERSHVYCLHRPTYTAPCGIEMALHRGQHDAAGPALRPEIQRAAYAFLLTDAGLSLRLGAMKPREVNGRQHLCFGCFHCDAPFPDDDLARCEDTVRSSNAWTTVHHSIVRMSGRFILNRPHWCFPHEGKYCTR